MAHFWRKCLWWRNIQNFAFSSALNESYTQKSWTEGLPFSAIFVHTSTPASMSWMLTFALLSCLLCCAIGIHVKLQFSSNLTILFSIDQGPKIPKIPQNRSKINFLANFVPEKFENKRNFSMTPPYEFVAHRWGQNRGCREKFCAPWKFYEPPSLRSEAAPCSSCAQKLPRYLGGSDAATLSTQAVSGKKKKSIYRLGSKCAEYGANVQPRWPAWSTPYTRDSLPCGSVLPCPEGANIHTGILIQHHKGYGSPGGGASIGRGLSSHHLPWGTPKV